MGNETPGGRVPQASQSRGGMLRVAKHPEAWRVTSRVAKLPIKKCSGNLDEDTTVGTILITASSQTNI